MLRWTIALLVLTLVSGAVAISGAEDDGVARFFFFAGLIALIVAAIVHIVRGRPPL